MEEIIDNWVFYAVLLVMLFGAFIIGYYFGGSYSKGVILGNKNKFPTTPIDQKVSPHNKHNPHIEIEELATPGPVRALKTRDRSGSLSNDAKFSIAESKLNFEKLGHGNRFNKDDLQKITGIGPFVEEKLNILGIDQYSQLANMNPKDIKTITELIDFFPGRIQRDNWKKQAIYLLSEKENQV